MIGIFAEFVVKNFMPNSEMSNEYITYPDSQWKIPRAIANDKFCDSHATRSKENDLIVPLTNHFAEVKLVASPTVKLDGIENPGFVHENPVQYRKEQIKFSLKDTRIRLRIISPQDESGLQPAHDNLSIIKLNDERLSSAPHSSSSRPKSLNDTTFSGLANKSPLQHESLDEMFSTYLANKGYSQSRQESLDARSPSDLTSSSSSRHKSLDSVSSSDLTSGSSSRQESLDAVSASDLTSSSWSRQESLDAVSTSDLAGSSSSRQSLDTISSTDLANNSYSRQNSEDALSSLDHSQQVKIKSGLSLTDDTTTESFIKLVTCRPTLCSARLDTWHKDKVTCPSCKGHSRPSTRSVRGLIKGFLKKFIHGS